MNNFERLNILIGFSFSQNNWFESGNVETIIVCSEYQSLKKKN